MRPISIVGDGAAALARRLAARLDGRVALVTRTDRIDDGEIADGAVPDGVDDGEIADGAVPGGADETGGGDDPDATAADTAIAFDGEGSWTGRGHVDGLDDVLDGLAPDHDYLVVAGESRLRVPTVLIGPGTDSGDVPGPVLAAADRTNAVDLDAVATELDDTEPWVTRETLVQRVERSADADRAGAVATFTGRVRTRDAPDDDPTTHLAFEKYEGVAADRMDAVAEEITGRDGVFDVRMCHRTGVIEAGEDIVFVVALAGHRREAFRAVEDGIDRLKDEVPIFKKEATEAETFWVHRRS